MIYREYLKRVLDFISSFCLIIILSPFMAVTSIFLIFSNSGKLFFTQLRPGKNAKPFKIIKFKTMTDKRDEQGNLLHDRYRITKIGKFIRASSLDELPQLINVLKGDKVLVGSRLLLKKYLTFYTMNKFLKSR